MTLFFDNEKLLCYPNNKVNILDLEMDKIINIKNNNVK